ncbi:60s ribosomal protein l13a-like protein [Lasius niger]|uniref:60s ribosomal protein l13a-like protein n=1 Tax=Lasius niger TaxID=67767 RepID=A0A0J7L478_LASNI|nr:60s ribosomal protein l13a-like protein [Lasius niger]
MTGFSEKPILIDGRGHLLGRLAAIVAKTILQGNKVIVVRSEQLNISGNFFRNKLKFMSFLRMIPHKTQRGKDALRRLKVYEGCPPPYDRRKRVVVPGAMRVMCLKPGRKYCHVGRLSHEVGWKYKAVVRTLENKRRVRAILEVQKRNKLKKLTKQAGEAVSKATEPYTKIINDFGYN